jgi:hypothetical protein
MTLSAGAGTKADMQQSRKVTTEQGQELAKYMECQYFETSAKKNTGVAGTLPKTLICRLQM